MDAKTTGTLSGDSLQRFLELDEWAEHVISERFEREQGDLYARFGEAGKQACRQDIRFTIDFLRPAVEFGLTQSFVQYISWLRNVLATRQIPAAHVSLMLSWLADFYQKELDPQSSQLVRLALETARDAPAEQDQVHAIGTHCPAAWEDTERLKTLLLNGRSRQAMTLLQGIMQNGSSLLDIELHLLQPALYQIGLDWQMNRISVAQEHLATTSAMSLMTQLSMTAEFAAPNGRRVLLACVAGNHHMVGLRMVGDGFEAAGWDVRYLGTNVPTPALADEAARFAPDLVGLSVSMPYQLNEVRHAMSSLRSALGETMPAVMIGGLAINGFPPVTQQLGTGHTATDASGAVGLANKICGNPS